MSEDPQTWEPRPIPEVTPETASYWEGAANGELRVGHCPECDLTFFYPRALCPDCLSEAETVSVDGNGTIYSYSFPSKVSGWPEEHLPLIVAYVKLAEGPHLLTNVVDCDPEDISIGATVTVDFVSTEREDIAIPVFRLKETA